MPSSVSSKPSTSKPQNEDDRKVKWLDDILGAGGDDGPSDTTKQMIIGGLSGWVTGFLAMKIGKAAATAIGGGIILLQIANHQGYININWSRLKRDVNNVTTKISEGDRKKKDLTAKLEKKFEKLADRAEDIASRFESRSKRWYEKLLGRESRDLHVFLCSFSVGTLIGIVTGT